MDYLIPQTCSVGLEPEGGALLNFCSKKLSWVSIYWTCVKIQKMNRHVYQEEYF